MDGVAGAKAATVTAAGDHNDRYDLPVDPLNESLECDDLMSLASTTLAGLNASPRELTRSPTPNEMAQV